MPDTSPQDTQVGNTRLAYEQLCTSYHAIDDFRAKLLGFLPLASGTGIFLLLENVTDPLKLGAIGAFGCLVTIGLFAYEIYGIRKCHALIETGAVCEVSLNVVGQFRGRPREVAGFINEPFAAGIIYPAVLAAWIYLGLFYLSAQAAVAVATLAFVSGALGTLAYNSYLRNHISGALRAPGAAPEGRAGRKLRSRERQTAPPPPERGRSPGMPPAQ